jgi:hypothetical protein
VGLYGVMDHNIFLLLKKKKNSGDAIDFKKLLKYEIRGIDPCKKKE